MKTFAMEDVEFVLDPRPGNQRGVSSSNRFILVKSDALLDTYRNWRFKRPETILELGLFEGGSLVLLDKLFQPKTLVGLDIRADPIVPLEEYRERNPHVLTHYGLSQDRPDVLRVARQHFPQGIDLVVDDASHHYAPTKASFEMLFPLLGVGGVYLIEDWAWSHRPGQQSADAPWANAPALTNLVMELVVMAAAHGAVAEVAIFSEAVAVVRGPGPMPGDPFDLSGALRGRTLGTL